MKQLFINLPVSNLEKTMQFYVALGFALNPLFTDEDQKCMIWSDTNYIMLQSKEFFSSYLKKPLIDAKKNQSSSHTLLVESIQKVNEMIENGLKFGGIEPAPVLDEGFMYLRSIEDLDGHLWGIMYLDVNKFRSHKGS